MNFIKDMFKALGVIIMFCSGGCTVLVVVIGLPSMAEKTLAGGKISDFFEAFLIPAICGGIPFLIGYGFFLLGRNTSRPGRPIPWDTSELPPKETEVPSSQDDIEKMNREIE